MTTARMKKMIVRRKEVIAVAATVRTRKKKWT
ncbi:hypothetical protein OESDEN_10397 [Oesophagostomum dentatum]|uniref:Uncharacterized protein n=1 Tax=Oesophagostomum dentatum TaxID=61180 RepID=A0A0B1T0U5_OESDE|nr:hypothetical protein OESDEN_10397 [Oesophagostomum dentatum]